MPRRRRRRSGFPWWLLLLIVLVAGGVAYRYRGLISAPGTTSAPQSSPTTGTPVELPPSRRMACERIAAPEVAQALKLTGVSAQRDSAPGSAEADACRWKSGKVEASLAVFDGAGLARQKPPQTAAGFYDSVVTGLEYERHDTPRALSGLGERAAVAGFGRDGGGDLVVLDHGRVLQVTLSAGGEAEARALATLAVRAYASP